MTACGSTEGYSHPKLEEKHPNATSRHPGTVRPESYHMRSAVGVADNHFEQLHYK